MIGFLNEYLVIGYSIGLAFLVAIIMVKAGHICGPRKFDEEKLSAYECGFEPFRHARIKFDITFILISLLFLIFDLEIIFLIPWVLYYVQIGVLGFVGIIFFLLLLLIGFILEWLRGVLNFESFDFVTL